MFPLLHEKPTTPRKRARIQVVLMFLVRCMEKGSVLSYFNVKVIGGIFNSKKFLLFVTNCSHLVTNCNFKVMNCCFKVIKHFLSGCSLFMLWHEGKEVDEMQNLPEFIL
jgi:hypothetical protein